MTDAGGGSPSPKAKPDARARAANAAVSAQLAAAKLRRAEASVTYEEATKQLLFIKDFQSDVEAVMNDRLAPVWIRVKAWIMRYSWGEYSLFCLGLDGYPKYQVDCASELALPPSRVSQAVRYGQLRGYLVDHPKLLEPVISPRLVAPPPDSSSDFGEFVEAWKVAHSTEFEELEVARSTVARIRKVVLADYKKFRQQEREKAASLLDLQTGNSETTGKPAALSPFEEDQQRIAQETRHPPAKSSAKAGMQAKDQTRAQEKAAVDYLFGEIAHMQKSYPNSDFSQTPINPHNKGDQGLVKRMLTELGSCDEEYLVGFTVHCAAKFKGFGLGGRKAKERKPGTESGPYSIGLLVNWAQDYARIAKPTAAETRTAERSPKVQRELAIIARVDAEWQALGEAEQRKLVQPHVKAIRADKSSASQLSEAEIYHQAGILARADIRERIESEEK